MSQPICQKCGVEIARNPGESPRTHSRRKYCSQKCSTSAQKGRSRKPLGKLKTCPACNGVMERKPKERPSKYKIRKYCSPACANSHHLNSLRKTCVHCGGEFGRRKYSNGKFETSTTYHKRTNCFKHECVTATRIKSRNQRPRKHNPDKPTRKPRQQVSTENREASPREPNKLPTPWGIKHRATTWEASKFEYVSTKGNCSKHPNEVLNVYGQCALCVLTSRRGQIRRPGLV